MMLYGHRGAKGEAPENTVAGFVHAWRHGIRRFEMDLVLSRDGIPMVIHDLSVDRTTRQKGKIAQFTARELSAMDARRNTAAWPGVTPIPRLSDVLDVIAGFEHLQLEVKSDQHARLNPLCNRLIELVQAHHWHERITLTSADTWFLREVRRRDPSISTGLVAEHRFPNPLSTALKLGCTHLILNWKLCNNTLIENSHRNGVHVSVWTVNSIHDMLQLEQMGVDSIITDYPTSSRLYFENRLRVGGAPIPHNLGPTPEAPVTAS
ncbi:MAG: glycerophosphodiester phosphodiesterase [Gammaproteobacteria bacterium]|nr:glycerophosphodiester phosphodiesterase [Gammaproteobacteria bacterium]